MVSRRERRAAARAAKAASDKQLQVQLANPERQVATTEASGRSLNLGRLAAFAAGGDVAKVKQVMDALTSKMEELGITEDSSLALPLPEVDEAPSANVRSFIQLGEPPVDTMTLQIAVATLRRRLG